MGHVKRMSILRDKLASEGIVVKISMGYPVSRKNLEKFGIVILDSRDDPFPDYIRENKISGQIFITVDNRGEGRKQADVVWDTLPHFDMTAKELKISLERCLINSELIGQAKKPGRLQIKKIDICDLTHNNLNIDLIQRPSEKRLSTNQFYQKLKKSRSIAVYFGQTMFEALFLGKVIFLYDISDYHKKLSDWFMSQIGSNPKLIRSLDGKGLARLCDFLVSKLEKI